MKEGNRPKEKGVQDDAQHRPVRGHMNQHPIFDFKAMGRPMRVAGFMSGSGTNIMRLMEREAGLKTDEGRSPFQVIFIYSDRSDGGCAGERIALEGGIPYFSYDIRRFYRNRSLPMTVRTREGLEARKEYDRVPRALLDAFKIDLVALGGYMSYTTLDRCVNVHPADLSILAPRKKRKYVGDNAVYDAIAAGEKTLRASTLWTDEGVDTGPLLMVSEPVPVTLPEPLEVLREDRERFLRVVHEHQLRLKEKGDWKIFPRTIEMIARGRMALDGGKNVYVDGIPVPRGYRE
jgi:folate-dependent phosphoribosylglycinamide formyltransferase PurN